MPDWSDISTGERIAILREDLTQEGLAERAGLSLEKVARAERNKSASLSTLVAVASALNTDVDVLLGQQAPRRHMGQDERAMLRAMARAVHDVGSGLLPGTARPAPLDDLEARVKSAWSLYWAGDYSGLGAVLPALLHGGAATLRDLPVGAEERALAVLSDAMQIAGCLANLHGARDLAYAGVGHARTYADRAGDPLRSARVDSAHSWVYLRDGRLDESRALADRAASRIEPSYRDTTPERLTVYGNLLTHCAVVSARMHTGAAKRAAGDYLSQVHAVGARLGSEHDFHGARFGPLTATAQAVGIAVTLEEPSKALTLAKSMTEPKLGHLAGAARNRYRLDVAMAQADAALYDASLDTLESVLHDSPQWARQQALPSVIFRKIEGAGTSRLRRVAAAIGAPLAESQGGRFAPATGKTAL